ncbi:YciI family protein [Roseospirillum parvum]|uniref:YCII-related domain-containing protein n=1 Tax=Roseospirillum parvum TaxID=83401 RepID=A0A1G7ZPS8_9PROT|nr:YciI family protein [Roseospirillum parvum]SDH10772.1 hypothetical protein SAMN05421742_104180 [Roseospirillum parvum]
MLFAIVCTDKPGHGEVRQATRQAHLDYAASFGPRIRVGGPMLGPDGQTMVGSLLLLEAETIDEARAFTENDPYAKAGLFESVVVRPFKQVMGSL